LEQSVDGGASIVRPSVRPTDQESRIRQALGIARGPLPRVDGRWLEKYYRYLSATLTFPFEACYAGEIAGQSPLMALVTVERLVAPAWDKIDHDWGLHCRVRHGLSNCVVPLVDLELDSDHPYAQIIEDHWYWFWNWRFDPKI
jgi:hypothetical protein